MKRIWISVAVGIVALLGMSVPSAYATEACGLTGHPGYNTPCGGGTPPPVCKPSSPHCN